jgi:hypothetical protein
MRQAANLGTITPPLTKGCTACYENQCAHQPNAPKWNGSDIDLERKSWKSKHGIAQI